MEQTIKEATPQEKIGAKMVTTADSLLYDKYQLRPYNPDLIYQKRGNYDLFDEMRQDEQVRSVLALKKSMILDCEWKVEVSNSDDEGETSEFEEGREFIEWNFQEVLPEIFEKKLYNILSSLDYGFSVSEKLFAYMDTPKWGKKIILKDIRTRAPHGFLFYQDESGDIIKIEQDTAKRNKIEIDPKKLLVFINEGEFDIPYGNSELNLGVYRAWWSKNALIKFWNIYLERFGMPTVVGTYPSGMIQHKADLEKVLKNIQAKTGIVVPEGVLVQLLQANSTGTQQSGYESAINYHNMMIARSMLVPDLLGFSGDKVSGGSYALGSEQFGIFYDIIELSRSQLARTVTKEIVEPLIQYNFGSQYKCRFCFERVDESKKEKQRAQWILGVNTGKIPVTDTHVNHFLNSVDFPEITEEEFSDIEKEKEEMKAQLQGQPNEKPGEPQDKQPPEKPDKPPKKEFAKRALTEFERRVDFEKIEREFNTVSEKYLPEVARIFKLSINALMDEVKRKRIIEKKRLDLVNGLDLKYMHKVENLFKVLMRDAISSGKSDVVDEKQFAVMDTPTELSNDDLGDWVNQYAFYTRTAEAEYILNKIRPIIAESIRTGKSINQASKMIDEALKGYDIELSAQRLETTVRTIYAKAYNEGRRQSFTSIGDEIAAYQYSAIMDDRTSDICESLDGKIFAPSEIGTYNPPNHFNCRSLLVPIFQGEIYELSELPAVKSTGGDFLELQ